MSWHLSWHRTTIRVGLPIPQPIPQPIPHTLTAPELRTALAVFAVTKTQRWPTRPAALPTPATVRHYRTARYSLWTALDGKDAPNPLRDVKPPRSDDPEPRALPYELMTASWPPCPNAAKGCETCHEVRF